MLLSTRWVEGIGWGVQYSTWPRSGSGSGETERGGTGDGASKNEDEQHSLESLGLVSASVVRS